jgi:hypothetical protein
MLGVDHLADQLGITTVLTRTGLKPVPSHLAGRMLYWGLVILTAIAALGALDVKAINQLATSFLNYLPHVLTAAVIGFGITLGGVALAAAIAFGLGAKDLAKEFLERMLSDKPRDRLPDDLKHL